MTIKSILESLNACEPLLSFQENEVREYVKKHHPAFKGIVNVMLKKYDIATKPERVKLVASLKKYFPPG